jgi:hypothetical protein
MDRWRKTGNVEAKPGTGHGRSPLEQHKPWLIDRIAAEPDLTPRATPASARSGASSTVTTSPSKKHCNGLGLVNLTAAGSHRGRLAAVLSLRSIQGLGAFTPIRAKEANRAIRLRGDEPR